MRPIAIAALAFAAAFAASAAGIAAADQEDPQIQKDMDNGVTDLGIDITQAGASPQSIRHFLTTLNPDARRGLQGGCRRALANQAAVAPPTVSFCRTLQSL